MVQSTKISRVLALDGHTIHKTSQETEPITLLLSGKPVTIMKKLNFL